MNYNGPTTHADWWKATEAKAERITAKQIGLDLLDDMPIMQVRREVAKLMAPMAANVSAKKYPASEKTRALLAATNKKRAKLGQPLISFE